LKILFCCEQFPPSTGGVSKVIYELASHLSAQGITIEVATTFDENRSITDFPYPVHQFKISGNTARGMTGEIGSYIEFIKNKKFDLIYVKAAQQWSFDLILDHIENIPSPVAFLPCGLPNLDDPKYSAYYQTLNVKLRFFAAFFFNSNLAKDYGWIHSKGFQNLYVIPNGASKAEFEKPQTGFRKKYGISPENILLLSVGNPRIQKGQLNAIKAFDHLQTDQPVTLVLIGKKINGFRVFIEKLYRKLKSLPPDPEHLLYDYTRNRRLNSGLKRVLCIEASRNETVACFFESDLFIFLSYIEYSPLVLFEAMAAGLPFLCTDVGNSREISKLCSSGFIYETSQPPQNMNEKDIVEISKTIWNLISNKTELKRLGVLSREYWKNHLTWEKISQLYLQSFEAIASKNLGKD